MIIHWFRRDLRLSDNTALNAAMQDSANADANALAGTSGVLPVYIASQWGGEHRWAGAPRQEFLCGSLAALAGDIEKHGGRLVFRRGDAIEELARLLNETDAKAVYYNCDPDPHGRETERRLHELAAQLGIRVQGFTDVTALHPVAARTGAGMPFRVFTPFSKAWQSIETPVPADPATERAAFRWAKSSVASLPVPTLADWGLTPTAAIPEPGEAAARKRMEAFLAGPVFRYGDLRDAPAEAYTSKLSPDLRWGTLSIRELIKRTREVAARSETAAHQKSAQKFISELIWREFYMAVLWHWPEVLEHEFNPQFRGLPWLWPGREAVRIPPFDAAPLPISADEAFQRWTTGTTGFPIVDAGMRQLAATGWMHNRVRMITAMFLTKDLHLDWRVGEQFFMKHLVDGEIASNNGGWQWSAGTGADAAPYFRIQNPWTQTAKFDPDGCYIKQWVPELRDVPSVKFLTAPAGLRIAPGYPLPMVDHARERDVTLAMFKLG